MSDAPDIVGGNAPRVTPIPASASEQYSEWIALAAEHYEGEIVIAV